MIKFRKNHVHSWLCSPYWLFSRFRRRPSGATLHSQRNNHSMATIQGYPTNILFQKNFQPGIASKIKILLVVIQFMQADDQISLRIILHSIPKFVIFLTNKYHVHLGIFKLFGNTIRQYLVSKIKLSKDSNGLARIFQVSWKIHPQKFNDIQLQFRSILLVTAEVACSCIALKL